MKYLKECNANQTTIDFFKKKNETIEKTEDETKDKTIEKDDNKNQ